MQPGIYQGRGCFLVKGLFDIILSLSPKRKAKQEKK